LDGNVILLLLGVLLGVYAVYEFLPVPRTSKLATTVQSFVAPGIRRPTTRPLAERATFPQTPSVTTNVEARTDTRVFRLWLPLAIVGLAFGLRAIDLTGSPFGFFCDEASNALDAYGIGHSLHDQYGTFLPAYFRALDDYRGGFHIYWETPFIMLFGLNEFAARFSSAVSGTLTVWLTYVFVAKAYNRVLGLATALVLATAPWHIIVSRIGFEFVSLPLAIALCLTFLYKGLERPRWLPLAFVFGALGMYTYQPARVFFPLLCLSWIVIYERDLLKQWKLSLLGVILGAVVLIPTVISILDGSFFARLNTLSGPPQSISDRLSTFAANYVAHFKPDFLFQTSTDPVLRHYIRGFGMLHGIEAPFLVLGVAALLWRHRRVDLLVIVWLIIYPIGTSIVSGPVSTRSVAGVIVIALVTALGAYVAVQGLVRLLSRLGALRPRAPLIASLGATACTIVALFATSMFGNAYFRDYPLYSSGFWGWQSGPEQIVAYFKAHSNDYAHEYMDIPFNAPDELLRFYTTPDDGRCTGCSLMSMGDPTAVHGAYLPKQNELWAVSADVFATSPVQTLPHRVVKDVTYPDGAVSFYIVATGPSIAPQSPTKSS